MPNTSKLFKIASLVLFILAAFAVISPFVNAALLAFIGAACYVAGDLV